MEVQQPKSKHLKSLFLFMQYRIKLFQETKKENLIALFFSLNFSVFQDHPQERLVKFMMKPPSPSPQLLNHVGVRHVLVLPYFIQLQYNKFYAMYVHWPFPFQDSQNPKAHSRISR